MLKSSQGGIQWNCIGVPGQTRHRLEQDATESDICRPEARILYGASKAALLIVADDFPDLSLEFLMGRALDNAMLNVGMKDIAKGQTFVPRVDVQQPLTTVNRGCV